MENYPIAAARALYGLRVSHSRWLEYIKGITRASRRSPRTGASINVLSVLPSNTHDIDTVDHDGQLNEMTMSRLADRGANGDDGMFGGLRADDEECGV